VETGWSAPCTSALNGGQGPTEPNIVQDVLEDPATVMQLCGHVNTSVNRAFGPFGPNGSLSGPVGPCATALLEASLMSGVPPPSEEAPMTAIRRRLDTGALDHLVSAAVAAPSVHNTQPWRFRFDPDTLTLQVRAVPERGLHEVDPSGRALHISVGAAVFNLRAAARHLGWEPAVRLLPDPADPRLLAQLRLAEARRPSTWPAPGERLYDAIWRRHSSRLPFSDRRPPAALMAELAEAAHVEGALLTVADRARALHLLRITAEAERRNCADTQRGHESRRWLRRAQQGVDFGIPAEALGPQDAFERVPVRDFSASRRPGELPAAPFERRPLIVVLSTAHDARVDWLRAGQALERVLLMATAYGVRSSLLHQAMEWPDLRWELRDRATGNEHVQLLIRLGYGPEGATTPRQSAAEALDDR
jgi:hypothetical protein